MHSRVYNNAVSFFFASLLFCIDVFLLNCFILLRISTCLSLGMIGNLEFVDCNDERVNRVRIRVSSRSSNEQVLDIHTQECIGQGSFGTVYRAVLHGFPSIALKVTTGKPNRLQQELDVLSRVCTKGHLALPRFEFGAMNASRDLLVIGMELCVPSTLHDLLLTTRIENEADMLFIGYQASQAVRCVHSEECIHRDIKLQNFVFDHLGNLKLIDFGLASTSIKPPAGDTVAGTVFFMSPEMAHNALNKERRVSVGISADIWSLGIVLFSIFTQRNPYSVSDSKGYSASVEHDNGTTKDKDLLRRVASADWRWPEDCRVSALMKELVSALLVGNPSDRPTIEWVLRHKVWESRRRSPPEAVTAFLGVQDDIFTSNDESYIERAVAKISSARAKQQPEPGPGSLDLTNARDEPASSSRGSLQFVTTNKVEVDGQTRVTNIYDVRSGQRRKDRKYLREISEVMRDVSASSSTKRMGERRQQTSSCGESAKRSKSKSMIHEGTFEENFSISTANETTKHPQELQTTSSSSLPGHNESFHSSGLDVEERGRMRDAHVENKCPITQREPSFINTVHRRRKRSRSEAVEEHVAELYRELVSEEERVRITFSFLLLSHQWQLTRFGIELEEDQERYNYAWLEAEQLKSVDHPHRFVLTTQKPKGKYRYGYVCDSCDYEFIPTPNTNFSFYHCKCGQDLCVDCYQTFSKKCTCSFCNKMFPNFRELGAHLPCATSEKRKGIKGDRSPLNTRAQSGTPRRDKQSERSSATPVSPSSTKTAASTYSAVSGRNREEETTPKRRAAQPKMSVSTFNRTLPTAREDSYSSLSSNDGGPAKLKRNRQHATPDGKWEPFEEIKKARGRATLPVLPSDEERESILHGPWVQYFYLYPPETALQEGTRVPPSSLFVYVIQAGRTGAMFLDGSNANIHSGVFSAMERLFFTVDQIHDDGSFSSTSYTLVQAKVHPRVVDAFELMQEVVTYDTNIRKQNRFPGESSVYQAPRATSTYKRDPFVFVRWFRLSDREGISVILLSNGTVQAFIGREYEIRWMISESENRFFLVRSNGYCEVVDQSFPVISTINELLYGSEN